MTVLCAISTAAIAGADPLPETGAELASSDEAPARAGSPPRVAILPVSGASTMVGASLRAQIARLLRTRGYRVVPSIPSVADTSQFQALARDNRLAAFVVTHLDARKRRQKLTVVVRDGARASVLGHWSVRGRAKDLGQLLAAGFWKHLGPRLSKARAPGVVTPASPAPQAVN